MKVPYYYNRCVVCEKDMHDVMPFCSQKCVEFYYEINGGLIEDEH